MMIIVQNVINMYKTDPIKFFMMIAIIYLILRSCNVIESFKPSNVSTEIDLQAISTVSQMAQKYIKAFDIDATGNVNFKKKVTLGGNKITLEQTGKISNVGGFNVTPTGVLNAGHINALGGGNVTVTGSIKGKRSIVKGAQHGWYEADATDFSEIKDFDRIYTVRCKPGDNRGHRGVGIFLSLIHI